jgi:hypothetical protein
MIPLVLVCLLGGNPALVKVQVAIDAGESDPPALARARALAEARRLAVRRAVGTRVQDRFYHYAQAQGATPMHAALRFTTSAQDGRIVDEQILGEELTAQPGRRGYRYQLTLRASVVPEGRLRSGCRVRLGLSRSAYGHGEEAQIRVETSRDTRLYLFSVGPDAAISPLVPRDGMDPPLVRAGVPFVFPAAADHARGWRFRALLPPGARVQMEWVKAVAIDPATPVMSVGRDLPSVLRRLAALSPEAWCEDSVGYTIHAQRKEER